MSRVYTASKTYTANSGLSAAFRQWRADSHCKFLHGYALEVRLDFSATKLDANGWVIDFGGLKPIKAWLESQFDHKTLIAQDDPELPWFKEAASRNILDLNILPAIGCEAFAGMIFAYVSDWLAQNNHAPRVQLTRVTVREHAGNEASVSKA